MWTSVPQIDEIFTRMSTSSAVGSGTGTSITSVLFGAGFNLTAAFILAGMVNPPKPGRRGADAAEGVQPSVGGYVSPEPSRGLRGRRDHSRYPPPATGATPTIT